MARSAPLDWPSSSINCGRDWYLARVAAPAWPTEPKWVRHPKVPMSATTEKRLICLAEKGSTSQRKISPMQLAAQILEDALSKLVDEK